MELLNQSRRDFRRETTNASGDCGNCIHAGRKNRMEHRIHSLGGFFSGTNQASHTFMWASGMNLRRAGKYKAQNMREMEKLLGIDS